MSFQSTIASKSTSAKMKTTKKFHFRKRGSKWFIQARETFVFFCAKVKRSCWLLGSWEKIKEKENWHTFVCVIFLCNIHFLGHILKCLECRWRCKIKMNIGLVKSSLSHFLILPQEVENGYSDNPNKSTRDVEGSLEQNSACFLHSHFL